MSIVAFVTDSFAPRRMVDHFGLSPPQQEKLPSAREILCVAGHGEGWGVPADKE